MSQEKLSVWISFIGRNGIQTKTEGGAKSNERNAGQGIRKRPSKYVYKEE